ncbi:hypothetical protein BO99DRAFT_176317 [Aspergillus violaceofuscus CBS 115571]|uniref:Uncharacterized protein n=1 Tax=Aspergillus violaceofuscus (strain CBS 115571) TaxID=1450538 RepID=A0A2V5HNX4_ASPV1|nr:hypothetical protein BO99DRAFT_176317 [Aspergillus violaceofuscus CBS 115571]
MRVSESVSQRVRISCCLENYGVHLCLWPFGTGGKNRWVESSSQSHDLYLHFFFSTPDSRSPDDDHSSFPSLFVLYSPCLNLCTSRRRGTHCGPRQRTNPLPSHASISIIGFNQHQYLPFTHLPFRMTDEPLFLSQNVPRLYSRILINHRVRQPIRLLCLRGGSGCRCPCSG